MECDCCCATNASDASGKGYSSQGRRRDSCHLYDIVPGGARNRKQELNSQYVDHQSRNGNADCAAGVRPSLHGVTCIAQCCEDGGCNPRRRGRAVWWNMGSGHQTKQLRKVLEVDPALHAHVGAAVVCSLNSRLILSKLETLSVNRCACCNLICTPAHCRSTCQTFASSSRLASRCTHVIPAGCICRIGPGGDPALNAAASLDSDESAPSGVPQITGDPSLYSSAAPQWRWQQYSASVITEQPFSFASARATADGTLVALYTPAGLSCLAALKCSSDCLNRTCFSPGASSQASRPIRASDDVTPDVTPSLLPKGELVAAQQCSGSEQWHLVTIAAPPEEEAAPDGENEQPLPVSPCCNSCHCGVSPYCIAARGLCVHNWAAKLCFARCRRGAPAFLSTGSPVLGGRHRRWHRPALPRVRNARLQTSSRCRSSPAKPCAGTCMLPHK